MKFILLTLLSFNILAIHFNSLNIELKFRIKNELSKKISDFKIEEYRLPSLKDIKDIKEIKKVEFLGNDFYGSTAFVLKTEKKKFFGSIVISQKVKHIYAKRIIKKDEIFNSDDFEATEIYQTNKEYKNAITSFDEINGKVARVTIKPFKEIYSHQFDTPYIIKKGDSVTINAKQGHLIISMIGIAKENGKLGKHIMVQASFNNKMLRAKVIAPKKVDFFIGE
jgi:flagella basal body P-ring formation protein FlgA